MKNLRRLIALGSVPAVRTHARVMSRAEELFLRAALEQLDVGPRSWEDLTQDQRGHWIMLAKEDLR